MFSEPHAVLLSSVLFVSAFPLHSQPPPSPPAAPPASECHHTGYVTTNADRFTGKTTVQTNFKPVAGSSVPKLYAWTSNGSTEYGILLTTISGGLRYPRCLTAFFLADSKPVLTTPVKHYSNRLIKAAERQSYLLGIPVGRLGALGLGFNRNTSPLFVEIVGVNLGTEAIGQLAAASTIEFKVCNDETVSSVEFVRASKELACMVGAAQELPPAPPPSASTPAQEPPPYSPPPSPPPSARERR